MNIDKIDLDSCAKVHIYIGDMASYGIYVLVSFCLKLDILANHYSKSIRKSKFSSYNNYTTNIPLFETYDELN